MKLNRFVLRCERKVVKRLRKDLGDDEQFYVNRVLAFLRDYDLQLTRREIRMVYYTWCKYVQLLDAEAADLFMEQIASRAGLRTEFLYAYVED